MVRMIFHFIFSTLFGVVSHFTHTTRLIPDIWSLILTSDTWFIHTAWYNLKNHFGITETILFRYLKCFPFTSNWISIFSGTVGAEIAPQSQLQKVCLIPKAERKFPSVEFNLKHVTECGKCRILEPCQTDHNYWTEHMLQPIPAFM